MAELGIAAAAVQFTDVGVRLLEVLVRVCTDIRHVPSKLRATVTELKGFIQLARAIDQNIRAPNIGPASTLNGALSPAHISFGLHLLSESIVQAQQLEGVLKPLLPKPNDNAIKRGWRAVSGLKMEKEILEKCMQIQNLKVNLILWFNNGSLFLFNDQILVSKRIETDVGYANQQVQSLRTESEASTSTMKNTLQCTQSGVSRLEGQLRTIQSDSQSSSSAIQSMLHKVDWDTNQIDQKVTSIDGSLSNVGTTIRAMYDLMKVLGQKSDSANTTLRNIEGSLTDMQRHANVPQNLTAEVFQNSCNQLADHACHHIGSHPELVANLLVDEVLETTDPEATTPQPTTPELTILGSTLGPTPEDGSESVVARPAGLTEEQPRTIRSLPLLTCTCSSRPSRHTLAWPFGSIYYNKRPKHQRGCPEAWRTRRPWTLGVRMLLQRLLARSFHTTFTASFGASGFSLSPSFTCHRIVDRKVSPAFLLIDSAREELHDSLKFPAIDDERGGFSSFPIRRIPAKQKRLFSATAILEDVRSRLYSLFCAGEASPHDQDIRGFTLLHDFVLLVMSMFELQIALSPQISDIIDMLVRGGVDVNATYKINARERSTTLNVLEMVFTLLRDPCSQIPPELIYQSVRVDSVLTRYECEASEKSITPEYMDASPWALNIFLRNPPIAYDCGYSQLCLAVIQRQEEELRRLIQCGHSVQQEPERTYSPLSLAVGWKAGLEILLNEGADPFPATLDALGRADEATLEITLPRCPMFAWWRLQRTSRTLDYSVLAYALYTRTSSMAIHLIVQRLAEDRSVFAELAWENLSRRQLRLLGINQRDKDIGLIQGRELQIAAELSANGIGIPTLIIPCPYTTVYHDNNMTTAAADELWACGFCAIDVPNAWGYTPLLLACSYLYRNTEMIGWFIEKGAGTLSFPERGIRSCLHALTAHLGKGGNILLYQTSLKRLSEACSAILTDSCTCHCSSRGCLPVNVLLKRWKSCSANDGWWTKSLKLQIWLSTSDASSVEQEEYYTEVCRLEIFERLGMAHICCKADHKWTDCKQYYLLNMTRMAEEEERELQDEDERTGLVKQLYAYLQLYDALRTEYAEPISTFWKAWWSTLSDVLPERLWEEHWDGEGFICTEVTDKEVKHEQQSEEEVDDTSSDARRFSEASGSRDMMATAEASVEPSNDSGSKKTQDEMLDEASSDDTDNGYRPDEGLIRSRMEFFLAGGGLAMIEDVFSRKIRSDEDDLMGYSSGEEDSDEEPSIGNEDSDAEISNTDDAF